MSPQYLLKQIAAISEKLLVGLPDKNSGLSNTPSTAQDVPPLRLSPFMHNFRVEMMRNGLLPQARKVAWTKVVQLAALYQQSYERACHDVFKMTRNQDYVALNEILDHMRRTYETLYEKTHLPRFLDDVLKTRAAYLCKVCPPSMISKERQAFNHEYTPLLEKYFEYNSYPTAHERQVLARKTRMSHRQIEVWFQNHRNRAKKDGRTLNRRSTTCLPSLESLEREISPFTLKANERKEEDTKDVSDGERQEEDSNINLIPSTDIFSSFAPSHAYPTKYPPYCIDDPFPNQNGVFKFEPPTWGRRPRRPTTSRSPIDMDELLAMFCKLNLCEGSSKKQNQQQCHYGSRLPWFSSTVVIPSPAPHPALIRTSYPSLSASQSSLSQFISGVQPSPPRSRSSTPETSILTITNSREVAPLPGCILKNALSAKGIAPPSPASSAPNSRTSSFSSVASFQSRTTSFSSLPLNGPGTPAAFECQSFTPDHFLNELFGPVSDHVANEYATHNYFSMNDIFSKQMSFNYLAAQS